MKIYTKTGDHGTTSLIGGDRVYKDHPRVETYGTIDELNSIVGIIVSLMSNNFSEIKNNLITIQKDLFEIEAIISNKNNSINQKVLENLKKSISNNEKLIDNLTDEMPDLKHFILPGGDLIASYFHLARTVARRCERLMVALSKKEKINIENQIYLNRLSDLFFTLARYINLKKNISEITWTK